MPGGFINGGFNIGRTMFPVPFGGFSGILDLYPGAAAAYSLRALRNNMGNVVNVRRSSDDAEQDFTAQEVSDGTLVTFTGAGDGFVETWYDQSGNGRHATQSTAASQPKIVDGGALVVDDEGNPSPFFDAIDDFLSVYVGDSTSEFSSFVAASFLLGTSSGGRIVSLVSGETSFTDNVSGNIIPHIRNSSNQSVASFSSAFFGTSSITYGNLFLHSCIFNTGTASNFLDGLFSGSKSVSYSLTDRRILLGRGEDRYLEGNISCYVLYDADQSANRAAIEANLAAQYGITLA